LFENDLQYGYLELALTTRWPNRNVTYRNIAWSGDTVWGEARSYISTPSAYDLLLEQLTKAQPTVVFVAYGAIEAQEGEEGLSHFEQGLTKLLDKIDQLGAEAILLSPIPVMSVETPAKIAPQNAQLELYAGAIAKAAAARIKQYIDIFRPLQDISKKVNLSENGIHLNEYGYYCLATTLEKELGLTPRRESVTINASKNTAQGTTFVKITNSGQPKGTLMFSVDESFLPLPLPEQGESKYKESSLEFAPVIKVTGLKKGIYTLSTDNCQVITASAKEWQEGVKIKSGAYFNQASQLRELILKKNQLFFQQYRPQNRTYILGFRSHEQGRHAKGLEELSIIITWLEGQIALKSIPQSTVYQLTAIK